MPTPQTPPPAADQPDDDQHNTQPPQDATPTDQPEDAAPGDDRAQLVLDFLEAIRAALDEKQGEAENAATVADADGDDFDTAEPAATRRPAAGSAAATADGPADFRSRFKDTTPQYKRDGLHTDDRAYADRFANDNFRDRVASGKYRGYFKPNTAQRETAHDIYLIRTTTRGFLRVWYYVKVSPLKKVMFLHDLKQGTVKIEDYGEVLRRGYGKHPAEEDIAYMEREYGYTTRRTWEEE